MSYNSKLHYVHFNTFLLIVKQTWALYTNSMPPTSFKLVLLLHAAKMSFKSSATGHHG